MFMHKEIMDEHASLGIWCTWRLFTSNCFIARYNWLSS